MTQLTKPTLEKQIDALVEMRERFLVMAITYKVGDQFDGDFQSIEDAIESLRELAALAEYGAAVSKRDAQLCRNEIAPGASKSEFEAGSNTGCHLCAAAIEREPLP